MSSPHKRGKQFLAEETETQESGGKITWWNSHSAFDRYYFYEMEC